MDTMGQLQAVKWAWEMLKTTNLDTRTSIRPDSEWVLFLDGKFTLYNYGFGIYDVEYSYDDMRYIMEPNLQELYDMTKISERISQWDLNRTVRGLMEFMTRNHGVFGSVPMNMFELAVLLDHIDGSPIWPRALYSTGE